MHSDPDLDQDISLAQLGKYLLGLGSLHRHAPVFRGGSMSLILKAPPAAAATSAPDRPPQVLVPFHRTEAISTAEAAELAGKHERTIRLWCEMHGIGRRVAGGPWRVS